MQKDFIVVTPDSGNGDATVTVVASENIGNERSSALNVAGGSMTRTISVSQKEGSFDPSTAPNGVYIQHTSGRLYLRSKWNAAWNNEANGVAVKILGLCQYVIAPIEQTGLNWFDNGTFVDGIQTTDNINVAKVDFNGKQNTDRIVDQLGTDSNYAARYCQSYTFKSGKQGYLGAVGEWFYATLNKDEIDACMALIGGLPLYNESTNNWAKWCSTQSSGSSTWRQNWKNINDLTTVAKNPMGVTNYCARPFSSLI